MRAPAKYLEKGLSVAAGGAWAVFSRLNQIAPGGSFTPRWSDLPMLKSYEKTKPPLGWPRQTDSLCPTCVREARQAILDGRRPLRVAAQREGRRDQGHDHRARRQDPDGEGLPEHGHFEDVMAIDTAFFKHLEDVFPGRDIRAHNDETLHNHGSSTIKYGRGSVLTVDLTNRCNMMCDPCFMDANQVGLRARADVGRHQDDARQRHQHQAAPPDVGAVLGRRADALALLPRRRPLRAQGRLQLGAGRDQRHRVRQEPRVRQARPPRPACAIAYLQFDGIGNAANSHRQVGNLFDVKLQAIENLHDAGVDIVPVVTIVNGVNNEQVGRDHRVRARQPEEDQLPRRSSRCRFTGRDEEITPRAPRRAALHARRTWRTT